MTAVLEVKSKTIGCCVEHFSMGDACSAEDFSNPLVAFVDRRRRSAPPIKLVVSIQAVGEKFWLAIIQREGLVDPPNKFAKSIGLDGYLEQVRMARIGKRVRHALEMNHRGVVRRQHLSKKIDDARGVYAATLIKLGVPIT
jgi:hypothetical protein